MQTGTLLAQRYRIEERLGEGGMGVVFRAHDTLLDRAVAVKALSPQLLGDDGLKRFLREAQAAAQLNHPNIVAIHDVLDDGEQRLIVMELIPGKTLRELLPMKWQDAVEAALQVLSALEFAHARGIIHRDIKPENIILTEQGTAKVMDFGLARSEGRSRLTHSGMIVGTVAYMAPEQALSGAVDARTDLYSLGCVLFEIITGKPPFVADDPFAVISMHINVPPVSPRFHAADIPTVLEAGVLRLLAKDPTERFQSASDAAGVLQAALTPLEAGQETPFSDVTPAASLFEMLVRGRLIDREEELATLKAALDTMLSGRGQVVLMAGEPGIGKTRLADELLVYARLRGCLALTGRCYEQEVSIPYLPFVEALREAVRALPDDRLRTTLGPNAPEVVKLVPELARRIQQLEPSPPLEPSQERLRLFESVRAFLAGIAQAQPLVLMLDDLHWGDTATLELLRYLARSLRGDRVLLLGTYRDVEVDRAHPLSTALAEMNRERLYRRILIRGLTREHVAAMIQAVFQTRNPVSPEMRDLVFQETEGNPFFVEEVLKHLVETGAIYRTETGWERKPIEELDVPQSVREVIGRRLEQVSEPCRRALTVASVVGRRFTFDVEQQSAGTSEDELLDALDEAGRAQLIREHGTGRESAYEFAHALIREVLYDGLAHRRRMALHQKVGEALEIVYGARTDDVIEDLAYHFTHAQASSVEKAIDYSLRAAKKSMGLFAHEEAVRFYKDTLDLLRELRDEAREADVQVSVGLALTYLDKTDEAVAAFEAALAFYERRGDRTTVARIHRLIGHALERHWEFQRAVTHLERALAGLDPATQLDDILQTHVDLARAHAFLDEDDPSELHGREALRLGKEAGSLSVQAHALTTLGLTAWHRTGRREDAAAYYREAIEVARQAPDVEGYYALGRALNNLAIFHWERGEPREALPLQQEAREAAGRARDTEQIAFHNLQLNLSYFILGQWDRAREYVADNLERPLSRINQQWSELRLHWMNGEWESAADVSQAILDYYRDNLGQGVVTAGGQLVWLLVDLERREEAADVATSMLPMYLEDRRYMAWATFIALPEALALGHRRESCEEICTAAEEYGRTSDAPIAVAAAAMGRAALALGDGQPDRAVTVLDSVLPQIGERFGPVVRARLLKRLARSLRVRGQDGDGERSRAVCVECLSLLDAMGDGRMAALVRAELEGATPP
ncbi:MAG TPA: protein kinase [bacterium]